MIRGGLRLLLFAALEALILAAIAVSFLATYLQQAADGVWGKVAPAHLTSLASLWILLFSLRFAIARFIPSDRLVKYLSAFVLSLASSTLLSYYALVLLSEKAWGRVITWPLAKAYVLQSSDFLGGLGVSPGLVYGSLLLALCISSIAFSRITFLGWVGGLRRLPLPIAFAGLATALGVGATTLYESMEAGSCRDGEPFRLTFRCGRAPSEQSTAIPKGTRELDALEDQARREYVVHPNVERRNVVLVVADALRPDHMSLYGYHRQTTPYLDTLHRSGKLFKFDRVYATCGESACGLRSILHSKYVHQFTEGSITLSEVLRLHGYDVHLVLSGDHTNFYELRSAYGRVSTYFDGASSKARYINDDRLVIDRLRELPTQGNSPIALQIHLMSTHGLGKREKASRVFEPEANYYLPSNRVFRSEANESATNYYDNGVLQLDGVLSQVFAVLETKGYLENALVVITADHGEMLGEHGYFSHGDAVHEEALRIPLILLQFGHEPSDLWAKDVASAIDIAPTILEELQMSIPSTWSGTPLHAHAVRERDFLYFQQGWCTGLFDLRERGVLWKYWNDLRGGEVAYELVGDPKEQDNRINDVALTLSGEWRRMVTQLSVFAY